MITDTLPAMRLRTSLFITATAVLAATGIRAVRWRAAGKAAPSAEGLLSADQARRLYDRLAPIYDAVAGAYALVGARHLHRRAVRALGLSPGDTAVDFGCGTGENLEALASAVGPSGRIVGVDLSAGMLERARQRAVRHGWDNVELVQADVRDFTVPDGTRGVVATFALEMVPGYDAVIERLAATMPAGGRVAVSGLRRPERWPEWLIRLGEGVNRPFGVTRAYESFRPWESVRQHLREVCYEERLFGAVYLSVGEAQRTATP